MYISDTLVLLSGNNGLEFLLVSVYKHFMWECGIGHPMSN